MTKIDAVENLTLKQRKYLVAVDGPSRQRGVSLFVALVFLVILTILGLTAMRVATMEERMSGNARDRSLAFQAAEAALRDAESDIENSGRISGMTGADANCTSGLCCNISALTCIEPTVPVYTNKNLKAAPSVAYGTYTSAAAIGGLTLQPRYLIEPFLFNGTNHYRITARGYGVNVDTQVTLQEVYSKE